MDTVTVTFKSESTKQESVVIIVNDDKGSFIQVAFEPDIYEERPVNEMNLCIQLTVRFLELLKKMSDPVRD